MAVAEPEEHGPPELVHRPIRIVTTRLISRKLRATAICNRVDCFVQGQGAGGTALIDRSPVRNVSWIGRGIGHHFYDSADVIAQGHPATIRQSGMHITGREDLDHLAR